MDQQDCPVETLGGNPPWGGSTLQSGPPPLRMLLAIKWGVSTGGFPPDKLAGPYGT